MYRGVTIYEMPAVFKLGAVLLRETEVETESRVFLRILFLFAFHTISPMDRLRKRLDRLGTLLDLEKVFADTCCEGKKNVHAHVCVDIFPNVTKTPYADLFHKVQILSTHTLSAHPLHASFTR